MKVECSVPCSFTGPLRSTRPHAIMRVTSLIESGEVMVQVPTRGKSDSTVIVSADDLIAAIEAAKKGDG